MVYVMGFIFVDMGLLVLVREVEVMFLRFFSGWKVSVFLILGLLVFFYVYNFVRDVLYFYL